MVQAGLVVIAVVMVIGQAGQNVQVSGTQSLALDDPLCIVSTAEITLVPLNHTVKRRSSRIPISLAVLPVSDFS